MNLEEARNILELSQDAAPVRSEDDVNSEVKKLMKICSKCGSEKEHLLFIKNICEQCIKTTRHDYHIKNKVKISDKKKLKYIELKHHLEQQFDEKMSWDNYGFYWNIDHIIPQSKLPYTSNAMCSIECS